jgi:hypothetical protein
MYGLLATLGSEKESRSIPTRVTAILEKARYAKPDQH